MNKKPTATFYLTDLTVTIQTEKSVLKTIIFPKDIVSGGEIIDVKAFEEFLAREICNGIKKVSAGVIILGSGLLYQRSTDKQEDLEKVKKELFSTIPFDKKYITEKTIETNAKTYLLATHKQFYEAVIAACSDNNITIIAVLPLSLFSDQDVVEAIDKQIVKAILSKEKLYEGGNFLTTEDSLPIPLEKKGQEVQKPEKTVLSEEPVSVLPKTAYSNVTVWNTTRLVVVLGFLMALTAILGSLIYLQINRFQLPGQVTQVAPALPTTPTPTEVPKETVKSDLKVSVQNGTGTAGQAGKVKALLEGIGYVSIDTGNADSSDHEKTEVVFSSKVSEKQQQEIKDLLLADFTAVTTSTDPTATIDITVITGTAK